MPSEPEWCFECDRDNPDAAEAFAGYLDELERLCNAATPGPWTSHQGSIWSASSRNPICDIDAGSPDEYDPDARFIEAARHALPKLIAKVRELQVKLDGSATIEAQARADRAEARLSNLVRRLKQWIEYVPDALRDSPLYRDLQNLVDAFAHGASDVEVQR